MSLIDRLWERITSKDVVSHAGDYKECVIGNLSYVLKRTSPTDIALKIYSGNDKESFGVVFRSVVNDPEHSPCVTQKYPPKGKYEFIHTQSAVGMMGTSLLGDYKEWDDAYIDKWIDDMFKGYGRLATWRLWVKTKFKELESSLLEPDWNVVACMIREFENKSGEIFTPPSKENP
jgi:hypothetical protein